VPTQLDLSHGGPYIARRLLSTMDFDGLAWGARNLRPTDWEQAAEPADWISTYAPSPTTSPTTWTPRSIEQQTGLTVEDGLALFTERYDVSSTSDTVRHIVTALGYLDDIEEDDTLPIGKDELADWWRTRQTRLVRHLSRNPL
jgi:hypothetical protein